MNWRPLAVLCLLVAVAPSASAQTTVMDFSSLQPYTNYDPAPQSFGDHLNLNVSNQTRTGFGDASTLCGSIEMWGAGYSSLSSAGFACTDGNVGEFFFEPLNGNSVTLNSLSIGSYLASTNGVGPSRAMSVRVFDSNWSELYSFSGNVTTTQQLLPAVSSSTGLYLQWGTSWNTGVNLISTTVGSNQAPVPEPSSVLLLSAGLGLIGMSAARRRREA